MKVPSVEAVAALVRVIVIVPFPLFFAFATSVPAVALALATDTKGLENEAALLFVRVIVAEPPVAIAEPPEYDSVVITESWWFTVTAPELAVPVLVEAKSG